MNQFKKPTACVISGSSRCIQRNYSNRGVLLIYLKFTYLYCLFKKIKLHRSYMGNVYDSVLVLRLESQQYPIPSSDC